MSRRWPIVLLLLSLSSAVTAATPTCRFDRLPTGEQRLGPWIDQSNWLAIEHHRLTLQAATTFMPAWRLAPTPAADRPAVPPVEGSLDDLPAVDPYDGKARSLGFLLDSRLAADGVVVLRNGQVVAERYRNGLLSDRPRLLLDATRPLLNLLGAISVSQGKLAADKSVSRYIPPLTASGGLRKLSIQRLLDGDERHTWSAEELAAWQQAAGWGEGAKGIGVRDWLAQPNLWDKSLSETPDARAAATPDDDLLAWALAESNGQPLARLFCEQLLRRAPPEHEVLWLSDAQGVELANGLGLSLRDFARLGQLLVEARGSRSRVKIPGWFIETLLASSGTRSPEIKGLSKGSARRYGFVHLGGAANRIALIGTHGTSLYIDFDKRLVIATFASHPQAYAPATLAVLEQAWKSVERGVVPVKKAK